MLQGAIMVLYPSASMDLAANKKPVSRKVHRVTRSQSTVYQSDNSQPRDDNMLCGAFAYGLNPLHGNINFLNLAAKYR